MCCVLRKDTGKGQEDSEPRPGEDKPAIAAIMEAIPMFILVGKHAPEWVALLKVSSLVTN